MRHRKRGRKLGRTRAHREALERNIVRSLFTFGRVITTAAKAKEFRPTAERLITWAKAGGLANFRRILSVVQNVTIAKKIVNDVAKRFGDRAGGYTRVIRLGGSRWGGDGHGQVAFNRLGDNGLRAIWELVVRKDQDEEKFLAGLGQRARDATETKQLEKKKGAAPKEKAKSKKEAAAAK